MSGTSKKHLQRVIGSGLQKIETTRVRITSGAQVSHLDRLVFGNGLALVFMVHETEDNGYVIEPKVVKAEGLHD